VRDEHEEQVAIRVGLDAAGIPNTYMVTI